MSLIAAGGAHTVACGKVNGAPTIVSFGSNTYGQLGTGFAGVHTNAVNGPVKVSDGEENLRSPLWNSRAHTVAQVAAGNDHSAVLTKSGMCYTWGRNDRGQLGIGSVSDRAHARPLNTWMPCLLEVFGTPIRFKSISCGHNFTMAVDQFRDVFTWGSGASGNLGHGDTSDRRVPTLVEVLAGQRVRMVAAGGAHALAAADHGLVFSWGRGDGGRLGLSDSVGHLVPRQIISLTEPICYVAAGFAHSALLGEKTGNLYTFGVGAYGRLGLGSDADVDRPRHVTEGIDGAPIARVCCGMFHTVILSRDAGLVWVCGAGSHGQLGLGLESRQNRLIPELLQRTWIGMRVVDIAAGDLHTVCVVVNEIEMSSVQVATFGFAPLGRLGHNVSDTICGVPRTIQEWSASGAAFDEGSGVVRHSWIVDAPEQHAFTDVEQLLENGGVEAAEAEGGAEISDGAAEVASSSSTDGGAGNVKSALAPLALQRAVSKRPTVTQVACGVCHSGAVANGRLFMWGSNEDGELGNGGSVTIDIPDESRTRYHYLDGPVASIACGDSYTLACTVVGTLFGWGRGDNFQLGNGVATPQVFEPAVCSSLMSYRIVSVSACETHSACITNDHTLFTFGTGAHGQLGLGRRNAVAPLPTRVVQLKDVAQCTLGAAHTVARTVGGRVWAFGSGWYGRLGTGRIENEFEPCLILGDLAERFVSFVAAGAEHTLAIADGDLYVWGRDEGRLGLGETHDERAVKLSPVRNDYIARMGSVISRASAGETHSLILTKNGEILSFGTSERRFMLGHGRRQSSQTEGSSSVSIATKKSKAKSTDEIEFSSVAAQHVLSTYDADADVEDAVERALNLGAFDLVHLEIEERSDARDLRCISSGGNHNLVCSATGEVWAWGNQDSGRLGTRNSQHAAVCAIRVHESHWAGSDAIDSTALIAGVNETHESTTGESKKTQESHDDESGDGSSGTDSETGEAAAASVSSKKGTMNERLLSVEGSAPGARGGAKHGKRALAFIAESKLALVRMQRELKNEPQSRRMHGLEQLLQETLEMRANLIECQYLEKVYKMKCEVKMLRNKIQMVVQSTLEATYGKRDEHKVGAGYMQLFIRNTRIFSLLFGNLSAHPLILDRLHVFIFKSSLTGVKMKGDDDVGELCNPAAFAMLVLHTYGYGKTPRLESLLLIVLAAMIKREISAISVYSDDDDDDGDDDDGYGDDDDDDNARGFPNVVERFCDYTSVVGRILFAFFRHTHIMEAHLGNEIAKPMLAFMGKESLEFDPCAVVRDLGDEAKRNGNPVEGGGGGGSGSNAYKKSAFELYNGDSSVRHVVAQRIDALVDESGLWLNWVLRSLSPAPRGISFVCRTIYLAACRRYTDVSESPASRKTARERARILVGKAVAMYLFRPALQFPKTFHIIPSMYPFTGCDQTNLRRIAQVITRCMMRRPYSLHGAEAKTWLAPINEFIAECGEKVAAAIDECVAGVEVHDEPQTSLLQDMVSSHFSDVHRPLCITVPTASISYVVRMLNHAGARALVRSFPFLAAQLAELRRDAAFMAHLHVAATAGSSKSNRASLNLRLDHTLHCEPSWAPLICKKSGVPLPESYAGGLRDVVRVRDLNAVRIAEVVTKVPEEAALKSILLDLENFSQVASSMSAQMLDLWLSEKLENEKERNDLVLAERTHAARRLVRTLYRDLAPMEAANRTVNLCQRFQENILKRVMLFNYISTCRESAVSLLGKALKANEELTAHRNQLQLFFAVLANGSSGEPNRQLAFAIAQTEGTKLSSENFVREGGGALGDVLSAGGQSDLSVLSKRGQALGACCSFGLEMLLDEKVVLHFNREEGGVVDALSSVSDISVRVASLPLSSGGAENDRRFRFVLTARSPKSSRSAKFEKSLENFDLALAHLMALKHQLVQSWRPTTLGGAPSVLLFHVHRLLAKLATHITVPELLLGKGLT